MSHGQRPRRSAKGRKQPATWSRGAAYASTRQCACATMDDAGHRHVCSQRLSHGGWHMDPGGYAWNPDDDGQHAQL